MGQEPAAPPAEGEPKAENEPKPEVKSPEDKPQTFDKEYVSQLRSEAAQRRTEAQQLKEKLEEYEERDKSETEKLSGKVGKLTDENKGLASENARLRVALDKQLPADLIDRLRGDTPEELAEDADKLLELVKNRTEQEKDPDFDGGPRDPAPDPKPPEVAHNDALLSVLGLSQNT